MTRRLIALCALVLLVAASCEQDECTCNCDDTAQVAEDVAAEVAPIPEECADDGMCNVADACGGNPFKYDNVDPDCGSCECNYFSGICEAAGDGSRDACACDWDCQGGAPACAQDDHCDTWCGTIEYTEPWAGVPEECFPLWMVGDPDCSSCTCNYYAHVCESAAKCNPCPCPCDPDCMGGVYIPCGDDSHCDAWCPTGTDPDCADYPEKDGKYCLD